MKAVVLGNGQLGSYVFNHWENYNGYSIDIVDYPNFDITKESECEKIVDEYDLIINCAAYTDVNSGDKEAMKCMQINSFGPIFLGSKLLDRNMKGGNKKLIHISSEVVYGSDDPNYIPMKEDDKKTPVNAYSSSKKAADDYFESLIKIGNGILVLRSGWLFGPNSDHNFIEKIRKLLTTKETIKVVTDQIGTLTSVDILLKAMKNFVIGKLPCGIYNIGNEGYASRYENAMFVKQIIQSTCEVTPCTSELFPRPVKIAKNSCMDMSKIRRYIDFRLPTWQEDVGRLLTGEMK